jgi:hypothetical protein
MRTKLNFFLTKVRQIATQVPTDFWLAFLIFTSIFLLSAVVESDLGFHLETGRYIAQNHHVPPTDLFSFTVPDYPYINHSWLTELLLWLSFDRFGLWGLSFFYTVLLSAAFYILTKSSAIPKKHFAHVIIVLILLIPLCVKIINFRTQIVTFLFL